MASDSKSGAVNSNRLGVMARPAQSYAGIYEELLVYKHFSALNQMKIGYYLYMPTRKSSDPILVGNYIQK